MSAILSCILCRRAILVNERDREQTQRLKAGKGGTVCQACQAKVIYECKHLAK